MTDDRKRKTGGEDARLRAIAYLDSAVAVTVRTDDLKAVLSALAESRAEVERLRTAADNALGVLIGCAIPAGGCDDRSAIIDAQRQLRAALNLEPRND